jgi:hypothetical protein
VAEKQGYPASYASAWPLPATAVQALPQTGEAAGAPAQNPNTPASANKVSTNKVSGATTKPQERN